MTHPIPLSEERVREIKEGCEGVTAGPWTACVHDVHDGILDAHIRAEIHGCNICNVIEGTSSARGEVTHADMQANAHHLARLDPQTVSALCDLALTALRANSGEGWQPIETAPKDGTPILISWPWSDPPCVVAWGKPAGFASDVWCWVPCHDQDIGQNPYMPTHWRPLPSPPIRSQHKEADQ